MVKRKFTRKKLWTKKEEELLIEVWKLYIYKIRGVRRNYHIMEEVAKELEKYGYTISATEVKTKIHNLTTRYVKEKSVFKETGTWSTWPLYSKVHRILGRFQKKDKNIIEEIIDSDNEISQTSNRNDIVICRCCVGECTSYKSLYNMGLFKGEKTTLATLLAFCTNLEFSNHENTKITKTPGFICTNCIHDLTKSYIFIKKVQDADKLFRVQLNKNNNMDNDKVQPEQSIVKIENENESDFNKTKNILELPQVANDKDKPDPNTYKKAEDYMEYILQDELERSEVIDYETIITKEEPKLQENEEIKVKTEIEDCDISKIYTDSQAESNINPLEITPNTKLDNCVINSLVKKVCKICSKQFCDKQTLKCHMQIHFDTTFNKCNVCDKASKSKCAFEEYKSTHFPNIYGRSSRQPSNIKKHSSSETETFTCHICGKQLSPMWRFKIHMLIHKGEKRSRNKPFSCDICGLAFYTYKKMWNHRNNHGGLRKFKCSKCYKRLSTAKQLERHMLGHTKKTSFNCKICSQTFNRESSMLIHLRFHISL